MADVTTKQNLARQLSQLISNIMAYDLHGKKIYLIGSAEYGPVNEPIRIRTTAGLYNKFGKKGTLQKAFHAIKYTTKDNEVYLVKTTGQHSTAYLNVDIQENDVMKNSFILVSSEANEIYNDISIIVDISSLTIILPPDLNIAQHRLVYDFDKYPNIGLLASAINNDTKHKRSCVYANYTVPSSAPTQDAFFCCNPDIVYMYGGQSCLDYNKNMLFHCLQDTYDLLESEEIDIIIPVDAFIDDVYPDDREAHEYQYGRKYYQQDKDYLTEDLLGNKLSYYNQLVNFCIRQLRFGIVTTGVIGFNPIYQSESQYLYESDDIIDKYIACLDYNRSISDNSDYGFLVSVVAGDIEYNSGTIIDNGYLAYGSFDASIPINIGNTNIKISDNISLYNEFTEESLSKLAQHGIVGFRHSPLYNTVVVYDGITSITKLDSPLSLYSNVRMVQMCISYLNKLFQFYIGMNFTYLMQKNIISNNMDTLLSAIQSRDIINRYSYTLTPNYNAGELTVDLNIETNFMTRALKITSVIQLTSEDN